MVHSLEDEAHSTMLSAQSKGPELFVRLARSKYYWCPLLNRNSDLGASQGWNDTKAGMLFVPFQHEVKVTFISIFTVLFMEVLLF